MELLQDDGSSASKPIATPFDPPIKLNSTTGASFPDASAYRRLIGRLLYLTNTRPDISYSVQHLSQYLSNPLVPHFDDAHRVLRYLKSSPAKGLFVSASSPLKLHGFAYSD